MPIDLRANVANDYQIWDGLETVQYRSKRKAGDQIDLVVGAALRRSLTVKEIQSSGGAYTSLDLNWLIPAVVLDPLLGGERCKPADLLRDSDNSPWMVLQADQIVMRTVWRLTCRNPIIAYDLRDLIRIEAPDRTPDGAGGLTGGFATKRDYAKLPAKIQELSADQVDERGKRTTRQLYSIFVYSERALSVTIEDRVVDEATGLIYEITGYQSPGRIDELFTIGAQRIQ